MAENIFRIYQDEIVPEGLLNVPPGESAMVETLQEGEKFFYRLVFLDKTGKTKRIVEIRASREE